MGNYGSGEFNVNECRLNLRLRKAQLAKDLKKHGPTLKFKDPLKYLQYHESLFALTVAYTALQSCKCDPPDMSFEVAKAVQRLRAKTAKKRRRPR
jgi:hypothetical protein